MKLYFPEITFSIAHYIPGHDKCGGIHGHTYFVRGLEITLPINDVFDDVGMSIDFGLIKGYFKTKWDHKFVFPEKDEGYWKHIYENTGHCAVHDNRLMLKHTTCEHMAEVIVADLVDILSERYYPGAYESIGIKYSYTGIKFSLWEGPNQAVKI